MKYQLEIKSVTESKTITAASSNADLALVDLTINYEYLSLNSPGMATLVGFKNTTLTPDDIKDGDLIFVYENSRPIYLGYIIQITEVTTAEEFVVKLNFDTILSQFTRQKMVNTPQDTVVIQAPLAAKDQTIFNVNKATTKIVFSTLLQFLMSGTLYTYLKNNNIFGASVNVAQTVYGAPQVLKEDTKVFYVPSIQYTKAEALLSVLYAYQIIVFQDFQGSLQFTLPSFSDSSSLSFLTGDPRIISVTKSRQSVQVTNTAITSLVQAGFILDTKAVNNKNIAAKVIPNKKYFPYLNQLLDSGYYTQTQYTERPFPNNVIYDPVLLNIKNFIDQQVSVLNLTSVPSNLEQENQPAMAKLLAARTLAESLTRSRNIEIVMIRDSGYTSIPVGQTFIVNNETWFAISATLRFTGRPSQNTLTVRGAPLATCTGLWQS